MRVRLTQAQRREIVEAYSKLFTPMVELGQRFGVSRQAVYKVLKGAGVDTSKKRVPVSCSSCGAALQRTKADIRKKTHHFCTPACYHAYQRWIGVVSRQGREEARRVVALHFELDDSHIVHHVDGDELNNEPSNLMVFASQGDHVRYRRGFRVSPLWEGSSLG